MGRYITKNKRRKEKKGWKEERKKKEDEIEYKRSSFLLIDYFNACVEFYGKSTKLYQNNKLFSYQTSSTV